MVWREEQRAIGELVHRSDDGRELEHCVGFATFTANATGRDADWFANIVRDLEWDGAAGSERLATLQGRLARLVEELDTEQRFSGPDDRAEWISEGLDYLARR